MGTVLHLKSKIVQKCFNADLDPNCFFSLTGIALLQCEQQVHNAQGLST